MPSRHHSQIVLYTFRDLCCYNKKTPSASQSIMITNISTVKQNSSAKTAAVIHYYTNIHDGDDDCITSDGKGEDD